MDFMLSEKDLILVFSDYASTITIAKAFIKKLEEDAQQHSDQYREKIAIDIGAHEALEEHMELWMRDLKIQLKKLEFDGRASTLRNFFHFTNYLLTLRSPLTKMGNQRYKVPVYNVTFPKEKEDQLIPELHTSKIKINKKYTNKNSTKI
ncbi:uncharacterized protein LOC143426829 [Xylocopa sonorina]|uniref:uncharacterized protein LOC143426829 n=1 Tax=Xylocopa sonorina TaxID=1818115 RepID=UPI00403AEECA